jgi:hypothetical protein
MEELCMLLLVGAKKGCQKAFVITCTFNIVAAFKVEDIKDVGEMVTRDKGGMTVVVPTHTAICVKCY